MSVGLGETFGDGDRLCENPDEVVEPVSPCLVKKVIG